MAWFCDASLLLGQPFSPGRFSRGQLPNTAFLLWLNIVRLAPKGCCTRGHSTHGACFPACFINRSSKVSFGSSILFRTASQASSALGLVFPMIMNSVPHSCFPPCGLFGLQIQQSFTAYNRNDTFLSQAHEDDGDGVGIMISIPDEQPGSRWFST